MRKEVKAPERFYIDLPLPNAKVKMPLKDCGQLCFSLLEIFIMSKPRNTIGDVLSSIRRHVRGEIFVQLLPYRTIRWRAEDVCRALAFFQRILARHKVQAGNRVLLWGANGPAWACAFLAPALKGVVIVPLDANTQTDFAREILAREKPRFAFVSLPQQKQLPQGLPSFALENLTPALLPPLTPTEATLSPEQLLEIVYTSGSIGKPKGVMLTHRNLLSNAHTALQTLWISPRARFLSLIPQSHMLEQNLGLIAPLLRGITIVYPAALRARAILEAMQEEKISGMVCVPAILQLLHDCIWRQASQAGQARMLRRMLNLAARIPRPLRPLLFSRIHRAFGGHFRTVLIGGAPLAPTLEKFWWLLGVEVFQGYGLTEAAPLVSANTRRHHRLGSVGMPLKGTEVRLAPDDEILVRGPNVMRGYAHDTAATREVLKGGWLHTGDIGSWDKDGFLYIRGRKKNVIITAAGMNVYPEDIEAALNADPAVRESVVGEVKIGGEPRIAAAVIPHHPPAAAADILRRVNARLSSHQQITRLVLWPDTDFPRTPTRKIIRKEVQQKLQQLIAGKLPTSPPTPPATTPREKLRALVAQAAGAAPARVKADTILTTLGIDSVKRMLLLALIEEEFDKILPEESIGPTTTFRQLYHALTSAAPALPPAPKLSRWFSFPLRALQFAFRLLTRWLLKPWLQIQSFPPQLPPPPYLLIANHASHLDSVAVWWALPWRHKLRLTIAAAKDYFFQYRFAGFLTRVLWGAFPLDREGNVRETMQNVGQLLDRGFIVLLYPEGTRTPTGKLQPFKRGIGLLAQAMRVPVVPVGIRGTYALLPRDRWRLRRGKVTVRFGSPRLFPAAAGVEEITRRLEKLVAHLCR
jgi:long-chain acyl-CoA synthetase